MAAKKKFRKISGNRKPTNENMLDDEFSLESQEAPSSTKKTIKKKTAKKKATRKKKNTNSEVLSYRHQDKRKNNPEVGMVKPENDPDEPRAVWKYDPHIDPELQFDSSRSQIENLIDEALQSGDKETMRGALQELKRMQSPYLNWAGKAERTSFEFDTVSLHVHERIDPASILAGVRKKMNDAKSVELDTQPDLFAAPFENLPLRDAIDFYKHERGWANRLIAGDSLLVMNSLLQKESLSGQVQMIYIDPPYGIKYRSNFQPFVSKRDVSNTDKDDDLTQEPEMIKAFRDTWELGIHSYLSYLRDRLLLSKELMSVSGSIFVQISDENLHYVRQLMDEIFGKENLVCTINFKKKANQKGELLESITDYILYYAKDKSTLKGKFRHLFTPTGAQSEVEYSSDLTGGGVFKTQVFEYPFEGRVYSPASGNSWKTNLDGMNRLSYAKRIKSSKTQIRYRRFASDFGMSALTNNWEDTGGAAGRTYVVQTAVKVIERCILMTTDPGDLVLDITCGSGTTAFVAEKWGRRWITTDTSRVAVTLAKQRLMTAGYDYYELKYPQEGLKSGFNYMTVPHIMQSSITNNPEIDDIYERKYPEIEAALKKFNKEAQQKLHEWEIPMVFSELWPESARKHFEELIESRLSMQKLIDTSILNHADQEILYDKPQISKDKLRITGPFTVEAVPAPTVLSLDDSDKPQEADVAIARSGESLRQHEWRDELLRTGVRGKGGQAFSFAELETLPESPYLHATGHLDDGDRVVVSFGPEHAALEQKQVALALSEAEKLRPSPKYIVFSAFEFDPEAAKDIDETKWPGVTLLRLKMDDDLHTHDLKRKKRSGNSFWLMGQPDVELQKQKDGRYIVEVHGFDYFDTKSGELISGGKNKIATWMLDTDYDERSLFPQQVFFPMAGKKNGWNKLKKEIRAELNAELLEYFHGTTSLPFAPGENRKIAVKIVDDRGIESLKIIALD